MPRPPTPGRGSPRGAPAVLVRVTSGTARPAQARFTGGFVIGRSPDCAVQVDETFVSRRHLEVRREGGRWLVKDLGTGSGTFSGGERVDEVPLEGVLEVELGQGGPRFEIAEEATTAARPIPASRPAAEPRSETQIIQRYLEPEGGAPAGRQTMMFRRAFARVQRRSSRKYQVVIGVVLVALAVATGVILHQSRKIDAMRATAEQLFYAMKSMELQAGQRAELARLRGDASQLAAVAESQARIAEMRKRYDGFVKQLGAHDRLSAEEQLIYRVAGLFGECDVNVPRGFVAEVRRFIRKWQATPRLARSLERAAQAGYGPEITRTLAEAGLPPHFVYLALQESGFDERAVGPPTRSGIAKGMWQFIPRTAERYGLRTGRLRDEPGYDPQDERFDWRKSSRAAASYLKDLTTQETQGSGLLAMASYNYGEDRLKAVIDAMPETPDGRNFWRLLSDKRVPQETYDYVLSIVAAAVICQDPRQFGVTVACPAGR